jgi:hypothetical protein
MADVALKLRISERLKKEARKAGLLSGAFLRGAIERELAGRTAARRLSRNVGRFRAAGVAPVTAEEVEAEIKAVRELKRVGRADHR